MFDVPFGFSCPSPCLREATACMLGSGRKFAASCTAMAGEMMAGDIIAKSQTDLWRLSDLPKEHVGTAILKSAVPLLERGTAASGVVWVKVAPECPQKPLQRPETRHEP